MPIFEYKCSKCGHIFEQFVIGEIKENKKSCPICGEPDTSRILSSFFSSGSVTGKPGPGGCGPVSGGFS